MTRVHALRHPVRARARALHYSWTKYRKRADDYRDRNRNRINWNADNGSVCEIYRVISRETKKNAHGALSWRLKVVNLSMIEKDFNWIPTIDWIRSDLRKEEKKRIKEKRRAEGKGQKKEDMG